MNPVANLLNPRQRLAWLRLLRTPRIGAVRFQELINVFGSAEAALEALPSFTARKGTPLRPPSVSEIEDEMAEAAKLGARFVAPGERGYPSALAQIERPPPLLCVRGSAEAVAHRPTVAIVGSRNASAGGLALAKNIASDLGAAGVVVASGLARGIDAAAHLGSLATGTMAFFGGGLSKTYPAEHESLAASIVDNGGALYSEMPLHWTARSQDFPRRNRLVAGSALGLLVVESAERSGSLITARQAGEIGRQVMAVPGFPLDPRSAGPNRLLRDGALLVRNAQDILQDLEPMLNAADSEVEQRFVLPELSPNASEPPKPGFSETEGQTNPESLDEPMRRAISATPTTFDLLVEAAQTPPGATRAWLLEHELAGEVVRYPGDRFAWAPGSSS